MHKYNYVIFHKGCLDGFSGFIVLSTTNTIEKDAIIYPDMPSSDYIPPNINGKNVIIIDVAYKKRVLEKIFTYANSVTFIDHHKTIKDDTKELVKEFKNKKNIIIVYNQKKSGASLTWKYFYDQKTPIFIRYIEDNDIGKWALKNVHEFIAGLRVNYNMSQSNENISKWKNLLTDRKEISKIIKKGRFLPAGR